MFQTRNHCPFLLWLHWLQGLPLGRLSLLPFLVCIRLHFLPLDCLPWLLAPGLIWGRGCRLEKRTRRRQCPERMPPRPDLAGDAEGLGADADQVKAEAPAVARGRRAGRVAEGLRGPRHFGR